MEETNNQEYIVIIKIEVIKNSYEVFIKDGLVPYYFNEETIIKYRVMKGKVFTKEEWDNILYFASISEAYQKTLSYADKRMRTISEVRKYLKKFNLDIKGEDLIIEDLKIKGYLNDDRLMKLLIESDIEALKGPLYIRQHLERRLFNEDDILNGVSSFDHEEIINKAKALGLKYLDKMKGIPVIKQRENLCNTLLRAGFTYYQVEEATRDFDYKPLDPNILEAEYQKLVLKGYDKLVIFNKLLTKGYTDDDIKTILLDFDIYA